MAPDHGDWDASPEAALAAARRYLRAPGPGPWPRWREADLPVPVRIAWLRAEIARDPAAAAGEPAGEVLYQAVHGLEALDAADPEGLVRALAGRDDPVLRAEALRLTREAVRAALLAPARARAVLPVLLAEGSPPGVVEGALRELAAPWAALDPLPGDRFARFLDHPAVAGAAVEAAARHGRADVLRAAAADPGGPPAPRRRAMELLGGLASRADVGGLVEIAGTDPLLLAGPAVRCLREMHVRGHFPGDEHVPAIVALALADHTVDAGDVATVLYTSRRALLDELAGAGPAGPGLPRRLELLVALAAQGTGGLPVGAAVAGFLAGAPDPGPVLEAIRALRYEAAEDAVLAALPRAPAAALGALEAVGGERTAAFLHGALGLAGGTAAAYLVPVRHRALELLWHLTDDPGERHALLARLDPRDLPARIASDLGRPDPRELEPLRAGLDPDRPVEALRRLARHGDAGTVPVLADLLLTVAAREPRIPPEALAALRGLGERLHERGALRPHCLLDAAGAEEAGNALAASVLLDLLDDPGLSAAERAVLLEALLDVPYGGTRARVHPLLRDRDRHVRKHAIALLAGDPGGHGARALAASLVTLTRAGDAQTVRQAVVALGRAGASGAAAAVADLLDHPNMNVKKAAAEALVHAGSPAAVPKLLSWLGRHDNPGLRESIGTALRAILGDAHTATLVAAADGAAGERARGLLVRALAGHVPERAARALAAQGSPAGRALLGLLPEAAAPAGPLDELAAGGWHAGTARRAVDLHERDPGALDRPRRPERLRAMLAHWLDLAAAADGRRDAVLRLALRLCPPPWTGAELDAFARSAGTLADGLAGIGDSHRDRLLAVLGEAVPRLPAAGALEIAARVRALPPAGRATLSLLRRCGAVLTRADLDRALAAAPGGEEAVLREAFGLEPRPPEGHGLDSRDRLDELITAFPGGGAAARGALLERMLELQPLGAPPWTLGEEARRPREPARAPRAGDLDQPRSAAQRDRLLAMLDDPGRSAAAARALLEWPEPGVREAVLRAFLQGRAGVPVTAALAGALNGLPLDELRTGDPGVRERAARAAAKLDPPHLARLVPLLLEWWKEDEGTGQAARQALRAADADAVAAALGGDLDAGNWGVLGLVAGRPLLRTPVLERARRRLLDAGLADRAADLVLVDGPFRDPEAARADAAALAALRDRSGPAPAREPRPSRKALFRTARTGAPEEARRALTLLAEEHDETAGGVPGFGGLLADLIGGSSPRVRLHAHRIARRVLDRPAYLERTALLLDDPRPDVVRSAVRTLAHGGWTPAVPDLVGLLADGRPAVRRAAADGLVLLGDAAVPALRHAAGRARPDRRRLYASLMERIAAAP
ncbi:HEAT repeat domain-containing protein [Actinomadura sp. 21ATH]|uniref:HEAT repeat domain-containing protein n=1 Tax=Actinomadura sp. 21ATH TaxID=1735444 RepID=UPI0035C0F248